MYTKLNIIMSCSYFYTNHCKLFYRVKHLTLIQYHNSAINNMCRSFKGNNYLFKTKRNIKPNNILPKYGILERYLSTNQQVQVKKIRKSEVLRLLSLAKPEKWKILGAVSLLLVSSAVTMAIPYSLGKVLDIIYSGDTNPIEARQKLNRLCGILVAVFLVGAFCNFGRIYILSCAGYRVTQTLRRRVFHSVMKQEQGWFDKRSTGELMNRLSADTQLVGHSLTGNLSDGLRSTFAVLAGSGMMVYTSPELAAVGLSVIPPIAVLAVIYGRFVRKITRAVQDGLAAASNVAEERISNVRTVKMFGREMREVQTYTDRISQVLHLGYQESLARALFYGAAGLTGNTIIIGVLYYGGAMVGEQSISVGGLSAFLMYAAYIGVSVGGLTRLYTDVNRSVGAAARLWELVDREPLIPMRGGIQFERPPVGRITFQNVRFGYVDDLPVLDDVRLEIKAGETVAVVGPSGSGKSTLAALLLRLYDPTSGAVLVDGVDVKKLDPIWLKRNIGAVSQEPILFACSIRDNILYGADDPEHVTQVQLMQVVQEANLAEFIDRLPDGLDTIVGERGLTLSGGQRQRVAIARALVKQPHILLLDEATSALDAKSEHLVREALERATRGRTVLTIAHRLSTIRNANVIAVLHDGRIAEMGTYDELTAKPDGKFRDLVMHQTFTDQK